MKKIQKWVWVYLLNKVIDFTDKTRLSAVQKCTMFDKVRHNENNNSVKANTWVWTNHRSRYSLLHTNIEGRKHQITDGKTRWIDSNEPQKDEKWVGRMNWTRVEEDRLWIIESYGLFTLETVKQGSSSLWVQGPKQLSSIKLELKTDFGEFLTVAL